MCPSRLCVWITDVRYALTLLINCMSDSDDAAVAPTLTLEAKKMKPFNEAIMAAIESGDIQNNNHALIGEIKKALDAATSIEELKCVILSLPTSNGSHGQAHAMNRVMKALQGEELLPVPEGGANNTWAKVSKSAALQAVVWNAVAGLFSKGKGEVRAKVLECLPPVAVPAIKIPKVSPVHNVHARAHAFPPEISEVSPLNTYTRPKRTPAAVSIIALRSLGLLLSPGASLSCPLPSPPPPFSAQNGLGGCRPPCPRCRAPGRHSLATEVQGARKGERGAERQSTGAPHRGRPGHRLCQLGEAHACLERHGTLSAQQPAPEAPRA